MLFAIYVSCFDVGASLQGFINSFVTQKLEIDFDQWENLNTFIWIGAVCLVSSVIMMPLLTVSYRHTYTN